MAHSKPETKVIKGLGPDSVPGMPGTFSDFAKNAQRAAKKGAIKRGKRK